MKPVAPIMEEIRRLAEQRRHRSGIASVAEQPGADAERLNLLPPMRMPDDQRLPGLVGFLDRLRRRALHAILVQQTQINRTLNDAMRQLSIGLEAAADERRSLEDALQMARLDIEELRSKIATLQLGVGPDAEKHARATDGARALRAYHEDPIAFALEARLRGDEASIRDRQQIHIERFRAAAWNDDAEVLDVACGRGEFLELLRDAAIPAHGVDLSPENVRRCQEKNLRVAQCDALAHLQVLMPQSLAGIFASHFIEHVAPDYLLAFLRASFAALRLGGCIVLETVNLDSLATHTTFHADPSHVTPIPPGTARLLLEGAGFAHVEVVYLSPYPSEMLLPLLAQDAAGAAVNESLGRLNQLLFAPREYAAIGLR